MNDQMDMQLLQRVSLDVVDDIVTFQRIFLSAEFGMQGGKTLTRTVVMNQKVMNPENLVVRQHKLRNVLDQLRIGLLAKERRDRLPGDIHTGIQDKHRHGK